MWSEWRRSDPKNKMKSSSGRSETGQMNGTAALKNCLTCSDSPAVVFIFNISLYSVLHVLCCCTNTHESLHMQAYHNNPPHHTCVDFSNPSLHAQICYLAGDLYCIRDYHTYHISSIRRCGYYFFLLHVGCGYYSRAAFISLESPQTSTTAG